MEQGSKLSLTPLCLLKDHPPPNCCCIYCLYYLYYYGRESRRTMPEEMKKAVGKENKRVKRKSKLATAKDMAGPSAAAVSAAGLCLFVVPACSNVPKALSLPLMPSP